MYLFWIVWHFTIENLSFRNSLTVHWLGVHAFTAEGQGLTPGWETKKPQAVQQSHTHTKKLSFPHKHDMSLHLFKTVFYLPIKFHTFFVKVKWSRSVVSDSSRPHGLWPIRLLSPWDFPDESTGLGCHCLLQGDSPPRDRTWVSRIVGRWFYRLSHHLPLN